MRIVLKSHHRPKKSTISSNFPIFPIHTVQIKLEKILHQKPLKNIKKSEKKSSERQKSLNLSTFFRNFGKKIDKPLIFSNPLWKNFFQEIIIKSGKILNLSEKMTFLHVKILGSGSIYSLRRNFVKKILWSFKKGKIINKNWWNNNSKISINLCKILRNRKKYKVFLIKMRKKTFKKVMI